VRRLRRRVTRETFRYPVKYSNLYVTLCNATCEDRGQVRSFTSARVITKRCRRLIFEHEHMSFDLVLVSLVFATVSTNAGTVTDFNNTLETFENIFPRLPDRKHDEYHFAPRGCRRRNVFISVNRTSAPTAG